LTKSLARVILGTNKGEKNMRIFVGSDIHGSSIDIDRFFASVDEYKATHPDTQVVLLGDIYNHGPRNPLPKAMRP